MLKQSLLLFEQKKFVNSMDALSSQFLHYDWNGNLYNSILENHIQKLAKILLIPTNVSKLNPNNSSSTTVTRLLHIATELYDIGGHTRVIMSFFEFLPSIKQTLYLTKNGQLPHIITKSIKSDRVIKCRQSMVQCAQELRDIAVDYDMVILHIHNYDTMPVLAFGAGYVGPPIAFFDHSDHFPWIGTSAIDARLVFRKAAFRLHSARGIEAARNVMMPLPASNEVVAYQQSHHANASSLAILKQTMRKKLGFAAETNQQVIMVAIASMYKFGNDYNFANLILSALKQNTNAHFIGVGLKEKWSEYFKKSNLNHTQFSLLENLNGIQITEYHIAADIHIDSFPFASLTSMLESLIAGSVGFGFCPWAHEHDLIFCAEPVDYGYPLDDSGSKSDVKFVNHAVLSCKTTLDYTTTLNNLLSNPKLLKSFQHVTKRAMVKHTGVGWATAMYKVFEKIMSLPRLPRSLSDKKLI